MSATQHLPYYETRSFTTTLRGAPVRYISKPGFPNWERVTRAALLLADAVAPPPSARILMFGSGHGALAAALARDAPDGQVRLVDPNVAALKMSECTLAASGIHNAEVRQSPLLLPEDVGAYDLVVMETPNGRGLTRRWLLEGRRALRVGGSLYLAGPKNEGIQAAIEDARALFGAATVLGYKEGNRVARVTKERVEQAEPDWAAQPGIAHDTWFEFTTTVRGSDYRIRSLPGVFGYDKLDAGTALLLEHLDITTGARVLDVGCGYGIIGLVAARLGAGLVDMVDVNLLAVLSARENIARNGVAAARALPSDALSEVVGNRYDVIVTNPPFHAGKAVDYDVAQTIIRHAHGLLDPGGRLLVVANKFIRYDRLMGELFARVRVVAETGRFHVLEAQ